jgi:hypothetical protein
MKHVVALARLAFSATVARAEQVARVSMTPDPRVHLVAYGYRFQ